MGRAPCCEKVGLKTGRWTTEEDEILNNYIKFHGEGSWRSVPKKAGLLRCGKSCRLRWINYLRSDLKRGNISVEEEKVIAGLHASLGSRWSMIAAHLPDRTDNEIKNYWISHLSRKILPTRRPTNPPAIAPTINRYKVRTKTKTKISQPTLKINKPAYQPSTMTNHDMVHLDHVPQAKQQTKVDTCAINDEDELAMVDNGEPMSLVIGEKEATRSVSESMEVGGTSSSTTIEALDDWNWDFDVEDGVLGFGGEEDDSILSWPWDST